MSGTTTSQCGLYVHVPFCTSKCGYCDFYSIPAAGADVTGLMDRLLVELDQRLAGKPAPITTVFVGGGTPTVLPIGELDRLMSALAPVAAASTCTEFTVEANPATLTTDNAHLLASAGVDRLSLGGQSFHATELACLGRRHRPENIASSMEVARRAGIGRLNLDLIFGIPGQTMASWIDTLDRALDLPVEHLAVYALTYEDGTPLAKQRACGQVVPCDEQIEADLYLMAIERLSTSGFKQYEISNFAKPGGRCRHNLIYWRNEPYIGVGPSAAGYVGGVRYRNAPDVAQYVKMIDETGDAAVETERIEGKRLAAEMAMLQLRLVEGIDLAGFAARTGSDAVQAFAPAIAQYEAMGLLTVTPTHVALTQRGRCVADTIIADFMGALDSAA